MAGDDAKRRGYFISCKVRRGHEERGNEGADHVRTEDDRPETKDPHEPVPGRMLPERDDGRDRVLGEELQAAQDHDEEACRVADAADGIRIRRSACVHGKDGAEVKGEGDHDAGCQRREEERPGMALEFLLPIVADDLEKQLGRQLFVFFDGDFGLRFLVFFIKIFFEYRHTFPPIWFFLYLIYIYYTKYYTKKRDFITTFFDMISVWGHRTKRVGN